jgi:thioredoxin reductase
MHLPDSPNQRALEMDYKYIILGAGPGGLQMGYFLQQKGRDYVILEQNDRAGSFFAQHPRHRKLISINKKHNFFEEEQFNLRHDWNSLLSDDPEMRFTRYSDELFPHADDICRYFQDYADRFGLKIAYGKTVAHISRDADGRFHVRTQQGDEYRCEVLLSAMGTVKPCVPDEIPGIELTTPYETHSTDLEQYRNKRVGILGQGNSAFETADHLSGTAATVHLLAKTPVKFAWDTHFVGDVRAVNNNLFDMYQLKSMHAVLTPRITAIRRLENGALETSHEYDYPHANPPGTLKLTREYDYIIRCTGWKYSTDELYDESIRPQTWKRGKYLNLTSSWESANVPDLFFIGGAMRSNDSKASSGFIHGFRYNIRTLHNLLEERYEGNAYPRTVMDPFDWNAFVDWMYQRFSVADAIFQMYGMLCDAVVIDADGSRAEILQDLPLAYARERDYGDKHVLLLTLEFGFHKFREPSTTFFGPSDPTDTDCAAFLHPVVRHLHRGEVSEFHFGDSLLARWDRPHGSGGAVMSYHYRFQQWAIERLGLDIELPEATSGGAYQAWSPEQIEAWRGQQLAEPEMESTCLRPF